MKTTKGKWRGDRLKAARAKADMTRTELAAACGVTAVTVGKWEDCVTSPPAERLAAIAAALSVSADYLLDRRPHAT